MKQGRIYLMLAVSMVLLVMAVFFSKQSPYTQQTFFQAIRNGDLQVVEDCICLGIDVNKKDTNSWTALLYATMTGNEKMVAMLLDNGAKRNVANEFGLTPQGR